MNKLVRKIPEKYAEAVLRVAVLASMCFATGMWENRGTLWFWYFFLFLYLSGSLFNSVFEVFFKKPKS